MLAVHLLAEIFELHNRAIDDAVLCQGLPRLQCGAGLLVSLGRQRQALPCRVVFAPAVTLIIDGRLQFLDGRLHSADMLTASCMLRSTDTVAMTVCWCMQSAKSALNK